MRVARWYVPGMSDQVLDLMVLIGFVVPGFLSFYVGTSPDSRRRAMVRWVCGAIGMLALFDLLRRTAMR
jgi:hypothetical protein